LLVGNSPFIRIGEGLPVNRQKSGLPLAFERYRLLTGLVMAALPVNVVLVMAGEPKSS